MDSIVVAVGGLMGDWTDRRLQKSNATMPDQLIESVDVLFARVTRKQG